jgi:hypothetical protein
MYEAFSHGSILRRCEFISALVLKIIVWHLETYITLLFRLVIVVSVRGIHRWSNFSHAS